MNTSHFKELLEKELAVVESELATVGRKNTTKYHGWEATEGALDTDRADETEVADGIEQFQTNNAVLEQLEVRLSEVKNALEKIENGKYGICEISGEEIELDRLEANPAAKTCKKHMGM